MPSFVVSCAPAGPLDSLINRLSVSIFPRRITCPLVLDNHSYINFSRRGFLALACALRLPPGVISNLFEERTMSDYGSSDHTYYSKLMSRVGALRNCTKPCRCKFVVRYLRLGLGPKVPIGGDLRAQFESQIGKLSRTA
jgi:hypothetical protein